MRQINQRPQLNVATFFFHKLIVYKAICPYMMTGVRRRRCRRRRCRRHCGCTSQSAAVVYPENCLTYNGQILLEPLNRSDL